MPVSIIGANPLPRSYSSPISRISSSFGPPELSFHGLQLNAVAMKSSLCRSRKRENSSEYQKLGYTNTLDRAQKNKCHTPTLEKVFWSSSPTNCCSGVWQEEMERTSSLAPFRWRGN